MDRRRTTDWDAVSRRDRKLVRRCLHGDEDAWMELWERYGPLVKAVARRMGLTPDEVEEVLQRAALVALEGLGGLREGGKLAGWLAGVARFQSLAVIRERRAGGDAETEVFVSEAPIHDRLEREEELAAVQTALLALDARCRRVIQALYLEDPPASYREVARREGIAPSSVGPIRGRCLARLRKILEELSQTGVPPH